MAKISRGTRETIKTILVLILAIALIIVYVVYPLYRSKAFFARVGIDSYTDTTAVANDPASFAQVGLSADTVRVEADGMTNLASVGLSTGTPSAAPKGMILLSLGESFDRTAAAPLARILVDSGFSVWTFDERACGYSTGKYRSDGQLESLDLEAFVSYLELHGKIHHPLIVVGHGIGGDAALLASEEEKRIDGVVAVEPFLSTDRMIARLRQQRGLTWFPFWEPTLWWWYKIRSGYAIDRRGVDKITAVANRTVVAMSPEGEASPEGLALKNGSKPELLRFVPVPASDAELANLVLGLTHP